MSGRELRELIASHGGAILIDPRLKKASSMELDQLGIKKLYIRRRTTKHYVVFKEGIAILYIDEDAAARLLLSMVSPGVPKRFVTSICRFNGVPESIIRKLGALLDDRLTSSPPPSTPIEFPKTLNSPVKSMT